MLKLKSINIVYFLTSALLLMVVFGYFFFEERKPVDCATTVYFDIVNNNVPYSFTGSVYLRFHQAADFDVNITEYGTINFNDMKYIIDRNTKMIVSNLSHSKYFELEDTIVNKTKNDNIPDEIYDILLSNRKFFFTSITEIADNILMIHSLTKTHLVCVKTN